jgi:phosphoglycerol geranylgeranyltransferase
MVGAARRAADGIRLIVGGGIKHRDQARELARAGADVIVTGNIIEERGAASTLREIIGGIEEGIDERKA